MSFEARVLRVLIASPGDVVEERRVIPEVIHDWNATHAEDKGVVLLPVKWETHATPELSGSPQRAINRQIVDDCDVLVGAFWTRIGTKTENAESGSAEEIRRVHRQGKPVRLYFSDVPVRLDDVDRDQYDRLLAFKDEMRKLGLVWAYDSIDKLKGDLIRHLSKTVNDELKARPRTFSSATHVYSSGLEPEDEAVLMRLGSAVENERSPWVAVRSLFGGDEPPKAFLDSLEVLNRRGLITRQNTGRREITDLVITPAGLDTYFSLSIPNHERWQAAVVNAYRPDEVTSAQEFAELLDLPELFVDRILQEWQADKRAIVSRTMNSTDIVHIGPELERLGNRFKPE